VHRRVRTIQDRINERINGLQRHARELLDAVAQDGQNLDNSEFFTNSPAGGEDRLNPGQLYTVMAPPTPLPVMYPTHIPTPASFHAFHINDPDIRRLCSGLREVILTHLPRIEATWRAGGAADVFAVRFTATVGHRIGATWFYDVDKAAAMAAMVGVTLGHIQPSGAGFTTLSPDTDTPRVGAMNALNAFTPLPLAAALQHIPSLNTRSAFTGASVSLIFCIAGDSAANTLTRMLASIYWLEALQRVLCRAINYGAPVGTSQEYLATLLGYVVNPHGRSDSPPHYFTVRLRPTVTTARPEYAFAVGCFVCLNTYDLVWRYRDITRSNTMPEEFRTPTPPALVPFLVPADVLATRAALDRPGEQPQQPPPGRNLRAINLDE
jgi:hypothetical protein